MFQKLKMVICCVVGRYGIVGVLGVIMVMKMGYDVIFYKTIGNIDSVLIKMVSSLLSLSYDNVCIYRNDDRYIGCSLVISFDDNIFVDVRFNNGYFCSVKKHLIDGMISFVNILNNSYGVSDSDYEYIRIVFCNGGGSSVRNDIYINYDNGVYDGFRVIFFDYRLAYNEYVNNACLSDDVVKWLSLLNISDFSFLDNFCEDGIISDEEVDKIKTSVDILGKDMEVVSLVEGIEDEWNKYCDIFSEIIMSYNNQLIKKMLSCGVDDDVIFDVLGINGSK